MVLEEISFEEFQYGYLNGTILAILNLYVTVITPIKFRPSRTYGLGGDFVSRFSRLPPWRSSWILERNDFSNSESLCCTDASHQVSAQSDLWFWRRCCLKNSNMATMATILDIRNRTILRGRVNK